MLGCIFLYIFNLSQKVSRKLQIYQCIFLFHVVICGSYLYSFPHLGAHEATLRIWKYICIIQYAFIMFLIYTFFIFGKDGKYTVATCICGFTTRRFSPNCTKAGTKELCVNVDLLSLIILVCQIHFYLNTFHSTCSCWI